jgi:hypothetical protein
VAMLTIEVVVVTTPVSKSVEVTSTRSTMLMGRVVIVVESTVSVTGSVTIAVVPLLAVFVVVSSNEVVVLVILDFTLVEVGRGDLTILVTVFSLRT